MSFPAIELSTAALADVDADATVLLVSDIAESSTPLAPFASLADTLTAVGFTGAAGSSIRVHAPEITARPLLVVGAGKDADENSVRDAAGTALRTLTGFDRVAIALTEELHAYAAAAAEGALLGGYQFDDYRLKKKPSRASTVILVADIEQEALRRAHAAADAVALVKDLISTPAEWQSPQQLAESAVSSLADLDNVSVQVLDEHQLEEQGYGGIIGVGKGSDRPPRLVRIDYTPSNATSHIALVGKGITFDTGGLSLKPAAAMMGMKFDMAGAATALSVVRATATLNLPVRVSAWLCIADNMPSGRATRPGDVLRMLDGQTVEVHNTDAEGRLVLADGLVAASREKPDVIVNIATLTGAIIIALGNRHTGVMGSDDAVKRYLESAQQADELAWSLPLPEYMEETLDSPIADMLNANMSERGGGSMFAGLFLQRFIGRTGDDENSPRIPWVHLDIAGSSEHKGAPHGYTDKGPTGATVRSLLTFVENAAQGA
ncbi:leucyl aminopeptidase [Microbacterium sp. YY-01]|uniref:leucyl aminopeptidase n=1 Tax=Microbacterium sp. YY-01 TaxID=3421634 RepID=UPI003D179062